MKLSVILPFIIIFLVVLYLIYNANASYQDGYAKGFAAERPIDRKGRRIEASFARRKTRRGSNFTKAKKRK